MTFIMLYNWQILFCFNPSNQIASTNVVCVSSVPKTTTCVHIVSRTTKQNASHVYSYENHMNKISLGKSVIDDNKNKYKIKYI